MFDPSNFFRSDSSADRMAGGVTLSRRADRSWSARLKRKWLGLANRLFPELAIAGYCGQCQVRMVLVYRQLERHREDGEILGINSWRCPACGRCEDQRFALECYHDVTM